MAWSMGRGEDKERVGLFTCTFHVVESCLELR